MILHLSIFKIFLYTLPLVLIPNWGFPAIDHEIRQTFPYPKISRVEDGELLQDIINSRKEVTPLSPTRKEAIRMLAYTVNEKKFLFINQIQVNGKRQQDLILLYIDRRETHHYRFNNPFFYNRKKKELMSTHNLIAGVTTVVATESQIIKHRRLPTDLLLIKKSGYISHGRHILPSLQICLDNGQERFLLGKIQSTLIQVSPIKVERMYLSSTGRMAVFILSQTYQEDNRPHQRMRVLGFDLYRAITNPLHKVTAKNEFALSPEQKELFFHKNFYYNERDELLYTEILYHSGNRKIEGDYSLY